MQWRRPLLQQMNLAALVPPPVARYGVAMILGQLGSARRLFFVAAFLLGTAAAFAESKVVRLRNERIETPDKVQQPVQSLAQNPALAHTGLFVLQFDGPVQAAWSTELKKRGVTLVRYVPDHAFIARAAGVKLRDLEALSFVRWTGAFRPEHKVHGGLLNQNVAAADEVGVSILLAADATPPQLAGARGLMKRGASETASRFGQVWRGQVTRAQLNALAASDAVLWIERGPQIRLFDETASKIVGGDSGAHPTYVQALGYDGSGVAVAVADSGLHLGDANLMHPDLLGRVDALFFTVNSPTPRTNTATARTSPASSRRTARRARSTTMGRCGDWASRRARMSSRSAFSMAKEITRLLRASSISRATRCRPARTSARTVGAMTRRAATI